MPKFDPTDKPEREQKIIPAGTYILGMKWFRRKVGKTSGKEYFSILHEVAGGPKAGDGFFSPLSIDMSKMGTQVRWNLLCEALGLTEPFEIGCHDEGNTEEGDQNIQNLFIGRAFKAEVEVTKSGDYVNNNIKSIAYLRNYTEKDWETVKDWERKFREKEDDFGAPPDDEPSQSTREDSFYDDQFDEDDIGF